MTTTLWPGGAFAAQSWGTTAQDTAAPQHSLLHSNAGIWLLGLVCGGGVYALQRMDAGPEWIAGLTAGWIATVWTLMQALHRPTLMAPYRLRRLATADFRLPLLTLCVFSAGLVSVGGVTRGAQVLTSTLVALLAVLLGRHDRRRQRPLQVAAFSGDDELERLASAVPSARFRLVSARRLERRAVERVPGGGLSALIEVCRATRPDVVVLGSQHMGEPALADHVTRLFAAGIKVRTVNEFIEEFAGRVPVVNLSGRWFLQDVMAVHVRWYRRSRAVLDVLVGLVGCVLLLLVLPVIAAAVKLDSPGPVLYRQVRIGRYGKTFVLMKFRTMREDAEIAGPQFAGLNDARVTRVGAVLRRSRIDELPQLWNVLRGEMSIIGPRPERPEFVAAARAVIPFFEFRHIVRPGITGWAQVTDGYASDLSGNISKLERDLYYLKRQSVLLDLEVLWRSVRCVVSMAGR